MAKAIEEFLPNEHNSALYAIVNNAATADPSDFLFDPTLKAHRTIMDVNFFGCSVLRKPCYRS
jgi:hypothetical protein